MKPKKVIGVYSPSASVNYLSDRLEFYERGISYLQKKGYIIKEGKCTNKNNFYHMSASPKERANEIHELFLDPDVDVIIPSIGGHVASQILAYLDIDLIKNNPKTFIGFSDSSLLATYISEKTNITTFHSVMDIAFGFGRLEIDNPFQEKGNFSEKLFFNLIDNDMIINESYSTWEPLQYGNCKGKLIGGNIKGIQALCGTPYEPNWKDKVLYIESMDQPHLIEQIFTHFKNIGIFNQVAGLIIGKMNHLKDTFYQNEIMPIKEFIKYIIDNEGLPIITEADIGHDIENIIMVNYSECYLNINKDNYQFKMEYKGKI